MENSNRLKFWGLEPICGIRISRSRHILMNRVGFMKTSTPQSVTYIFPASLCGFRCCEAVCGTGFRVFVRLFTGTRRSKYSQTDAECLRPAGYSYLPDAVRSRCPSVASIKRNKPSEDPSFFVFTALSLPELLADSLKSLYVTISSHLHGLICSY